MEDSQFAEYIQCAAKCEAIAVEIFPSYSQHYADVEAMMRVPPDVMACSFVHKLLFMQSKLKTFEKMRSDLQIPSVGASAAKAVLQQPMRL